ncbi:MAG: hypothetical protein RR007_06800, partial [Kiritimatiellia bacterium]
KGCCHWKKSRNNPVRVDFRLLSANCKVNRLDRVDLFHHGTNEKNPYIYDLTLPVRRNAS